MSGTVMSPIKVYSIPGEKFPHDGRNAELTAFEEDMDMIIHENPSIDSTLPFIHNLTEAFYKLHPVVVVYEDCAFVDPPHHNVMEGTRGIQTGSARHNEYYSRAPL